MLDHPTRDELAAYPETVPELGDRFTPPDPEPDPEPEPRPEPLAGWTDAELRAAWGDR